MSMFYIQDENDQFYNIGRATYVNEFRKEDKSNK